MKCLDIGPSSCPIEGFDTLDLVAAPHVKLTYKAAWGLQPLPIPDNTYDLVFSSHVIEHIPWFDTVPALKEVLRILVPNGQFECWTVDFAVVVQAYLNQVAPDDWDCHGRATNATLWCAARTFAYDKYAQSGYWHKALFDRKHLTDCFQQAGFVNIGRLSKTRGHDHGPVNLGVIGFKP